VGDETLTTGKLGVLADSHDNVPKVHQAVEVFNRAEVELVIHAGDFIAPFALEPLAGLRCPVVGVFGNNDGERLGLAKKIQGFGEIYDPLAEVEVGGRKVAAVHYPELALPLAASGAYHLVIYGHTHRIEVQPGATLLLNPGEAGGWLTGHATVAVVDLAAMVAEIVELE
jgi:putative phosphoesterase